MGYSIVWITDFSSKKESDENYVSTKYTIKYHLRGQNRFTAHEDEPVNLEIRTSGLGGAF